MMDKEKIAKYPRNPRARGMSYENRLKRYYQDKDQLLRDNMGIPAKELQEKHEKLLAWWNV